MGEELVERFRRFYRSFIANLFIWNPFVAVILRSFPTYLAENVPQGVATDGKSIYIDVNLAEVGRARLLGAKLIHVAMHIGLKHPYRAMRLLKTYGDSDLVRAVIAAAADAKCSQYMPEKAMKVIREAGENLATNEDFEEIVDDPAKMSMEELVTEVLKHLSRRGGGGSQSGCPCGAGSRSGAEGGGSDLMKKVMSYAASGSDVLTEPEKMVIIAEVLDGEPDIVNSKSLEELEAAASRVISRALVSAKVAGKLPAGVEEVVEGMAPRSSVDWLAVLRRELVKHVGRLVRRTFAVPNKKFFVDGRDDFPGRVITGLSRVVIFADTSGSISTDELRQMAREISEIFRRVRPVEIVVIPWDADVYDPVPLRTYFDILNRVEKRSRWVGRGGTEIAPALERYIKKHYRVGDAVVIISDWEIGDIHEPHVQRMLRLIGRNSVIAIAATLKPMGRDPVVPKNWRKLVVNVFSENPVPA